MTDPNKRRFDAAAKTWDEEPRRVQLAEAVADAVLRCACVDSEMEALDYGCGTGLVTLKLAANVRSIVGADISEGMLSVLRDKIAARGVSNVSTIVLDLRHDPPLKRRFDLIVSSMTLHHLEDPASVIGKLAAMLKPGGRLCVADLDAESGDFHTDKTGVHHAGFDRDRVRGMFEEAGLGCVTVDTAYVFEREAQGVLREFSVFLACGRVRTGASLQ